MSQFFSCCHHEITAYIWFTAQSNYLLTPPLLWSPISDILVTLNAIQVSDSHALLHVIVFCLQLTMVRLSIVLLYNLEKN